MYVLFFSIRTNRLSVEFMATVIPALWQLENLMVTNVRKIIDIHVGEVFHIYVTFCQRVSGSLAPVTNTLPIHTYHLVFSNIAIEKYWKSMNIKNNGGFMGKSMVSSLYREGDFPSHGAGAATWVRTSLRPLSCHAKRPLRRKSFGSR